MNEITTWQQGDFTEKPEHARLSDRMKERHREFESRAVRPSPEGNVICTTFDPEKAKWIAERLNLAATLEKMARDFATGKTDGSEIADFIRATLDADQTTGTELRR